MKPERFISAANRRALHRAGRLPYYHMGPADARVWKLVLEESLILADKYEYDVRLGGVGAALVDSGHEHFRMWENLLRKRVDVVAWKKGVPWLCEVKPFGGFAALGQALGYADLWEREKGTSPTPVPCVVCAVVDPDLSLTFLRYGVQVVALSPEMADLALL